MEKIVFDRVHRTGRARPVFNRIVLVKFSSYEGRQIVLSHIKHLDREKYGVNEQLPREQTERKKQLMPVYKAARRDIKNAKWSREKLIIDGKTKEALNSQLPNLCTLLNYIIDLLFSIIIIIVFHYQHFIHISVLCSMS